MQVEQIPAPAQKSLAPRRKLHGNPTFVSNKHAKLDENFAGFAYMQCSDSQAVTVNSNRYYAHYTFTRVRHLSFFILGNALKYVTSTR